MRTSTADLLSAYSQIQLSLLSIQQLDNMLTDAVSRCKEGAPDVCRGSTDEARSKDRILCNVIQDPAQYVMAHVANPLLVVARAMLFIETRPNGMKAIASDPLIKELWDYCIHFRQGLIGMVDVRVVPSQGVFGFDLLRPWAIALRTKTAIKAELERRRVIVRPLFNVHLHDPPHRDHYQYLTEQRREYLRSESWIDLFSEASPDTVRWHILTPNSERICDPLVA